MIDYTCMLCHIQLTQADCTPHYATTCRKINKYGRYPTRFPLSFFLSSLTTAEKPRQIMPLGCPCCYKRQVLCRHHSKLGLFSPTPLTLHSCIAKHHLLLFCPEQSQLTKKRKKEKEKETHDNSCCQTKAKQKTVQKGYRQVQQQKLLVGEAGGKHLLSVTVGGTGCRPAERRGRG